MAKVKTLFLAILGIAVGWQAYNLTPQKPSTYQNPQSENKEYAITLTKNGFSPRNITISNGDTIIFKNIENEYFWPSSDVHPTHEIYQEFDPLEPVKKEWRFKFNRIGEWEYHDHLKPYFTGKITVLNDSTRNEPTENCSNLESVNNSEKKEACFRELLANAVEKGGVKSALSVFKKLFQTYPLFTKQCHLYAHSIGDVTYAEYLINGGRYDSLDFPKETFYCGYGFFHGFLEHLFRDNPDIKEARKFCDYLDKKMSPQIPRIRLNCFHGMGHGFLTEPPPKPTWGKPEEMVSSPLSKCLMVSEVKAEISECNQGVFNTIANWIAVSNYGLKPNPERPMEICEKQSKRQYKLDCYYELSMRINTYVNDDIKQIANKYVSEIKDDEIAKMVIHSASASVIQGAQDKSNHDEYILACDSIQERLRESCLRGLIGGFIAHGEPDKEYVNAIKVCESKRLSPSIKETCYKFLFATMKGAYDKNKINDICKTINTTYNKYCYE